MKARNYVVFTFAIAVIAASCSKGDTGPAGPIGATGASGLNGIANISVTTYTISPSYIPWIANSTPSYHWIAACADTNITANNVDVVQAYWTTTLGTSWSALPTTSLINLGDDLGYSYKDDSVFFTYYTGGTSAQAPSSYVNYTTIIFKVTVIPPGLQLKYPGVNWKNAAEVASLPEIQAALNGARL